MPKMRAIEPQSNKKPARRALLLAITLLIPLALFAAVELALRAAGVGALEPLFVRAPEAPGYLQPNPDFVRRFFSRPDQAPSVAIDTTYFRAAKPIGTVRIFVQGESSAAGFPYGRWASPGALLQQRLQRSLPEREVEVITLAMAAATTYVLLDQVDEIIAQQPDAVVIYTGHNEFLGIGGVGSSLAAAKSPTLARLTQQLRRLRFYRVLEGAMAPNKSGTPPASGTLMARVAREREIAYGTPMFRAAETQFADNLRRILDRYRAAKIPVYIGTLASNERDQPPFASVTAEGAQSAAALYAGAQELDRAGRYAEARAKYLDAKDRDALRFRAPESFNQILRDAAASTGAVLVDSQRAVAQSSRNGIIGNDLMLEHLHPSVDGYFALASAYYGAIQPTISGAAEVPDDVARREIPATAVERLGGEYRVQILKNDWPFVPERRAVTFPAPAGPIESIAQQWFTNRLTWPNAMSAALQHYQNIGDVAEISRISANLANAFVNLAAPNQAAAVAMLRANEPERALAFAARAVALEPTSPDYLLTLAEAQFRSGRAAQSEASLRQILERDPNEQRAKYWLGIVRQQTSVTE
jgi:lysophospholipase L1-like esterase